MIFRHSLFIVLMFVFAVHAASPRTVTHKSKTDFERGTPKNVTVTHDGTLKTAPQKTKLFDSGEPFIWSIAEDSKANLYFGAANDGKLFKRSARGDSSLVLDTDELAIFALAIDAQDNVYAATSPKGKIYKITPTGAATTFFDPDAEYIWDLDFDDNGNLLVATGEKAFIYRVTPEGESTTFFKGEQNHIRTLVRDGETIYAGTSAAGFVYRFRPNEEPFVVFDPKMEEVNDIVVGHDGYLYASAFGYSIMMPKSAATGRQEQDEDDNGENGNNSNDDASLSPQTINLERMIAASTRMPTSLFRISPEGYAKDLWVGADEKIQSIAAYGESILVGSGTSGKLMTINEEGELSILLENEESHITDILKNSDRIIYGTSNLGRVYQLESTTADTASFMSETIDAGLPAQWGILTWEGNEAASATRFFARSGNTEQPSQTWSDWTAVQQDGEVWRIKSPDARFVQWKCELKNKETQINKVEISYIQKNLAPNISYIVIHPPNDYYEPNNKKSSNPDGIKFPSPLPNKQTQKGYRSIDWVFEDPNFDALIFEIYYRQKGSEKWRQMAKDVDTNIYSWDSAQMADGEYEIKVVVSDKLSNPDNLAQKGEKISKPFIIDNTGPVIKTGNNKTQDVLTVRISDEWNPLQKVHVSIDAQKWKIIYPDDAILDSKSENFTIELPDTDPHDVAIKATDSVDNVSVVHVATK